MALDSYSSLKASLDTWLSRNDVNSVVGSDIVRLAEARLEQDPRLKSEAYEEQTVTGDSHELPDDIREVTELWVDASNQRGPINIVSPSALREIKVGLGGTGIPQYAAIRTDTDPPTLDFAPAPDGTYTYGLTYVRLLPSLSDSATTNWLLTKAPHIYLWACMAEAELFLVEDQRSGIWEGKLSGALDNWLLDYQRRKYGGNLIARPRRALGV